ncbi:RNA recognition motif domain-containing protein [Ditylenchus destructor]|uniref:RNA recognition motif domain-containing protein n=1 Tax=Ditylenchus destructor TaxID=166010 RepID=A0AAD4R571_9BILA|nr:RNA recognition motif domain-containing protein [Ditylenchus destructor]
MDTSHFPRQKKYGQLTQCNVKTDLKTGQSRGFGYIGFESQEELDRALKDQPHVIDGVEVKINYETNELDLVVDSLPRNISDESLEKSLLNLFSRYGQVRDCMFIKNSAGTTTAFVALSSKDEDSLDRALNSQPHSIDSQVVTVEHSPPPPRELTMFVGNLSPKKTDESLRKYFSKYGQLTQSEVKIDSKTGQSRGFGYVGFRSKEELERAQAAQPHIIDGVKVTFNSKGQFLVIDSLSPNITEDSLREFFSQYGQVQDCRRITNSVGRTTAFVTMSNEEETSRALADRPHYIKGKLVSTHLKGREFSLRLLDIPEHTTDEDLYETFSKS